MRARLARASRRAKRTDDPTDRAEVRRLQSEYAAERLADYVREVVAKFPPLTDAQRDSIAALLRPIGGDSVD